MNLRVNRRVQDAVSISDLALLAQRRLPRVIWDYLDGGAEDETALRANRDAFTQWRLCPHVLMGARERDLSISLFGRTHPVPFLIGPTGLNGIFWPGADIACARAAAARGITFTSSTAANASMEAIAAASAGPKWFQLYPWGDRGLWARLMERARDAQFEALIVTVDSLVPGKRERDLRNRFAHQLRMTPAVMFDAICHPRWLASVWLRHGMPRLENIAEFAEPDADARALAEFTYQHRNPSLSWGDMAWIRARWRGPLLVKGILSATDIAAAVDAGVDGAIVSNHGGRQLDAAPATLEVLPEIVDAAGQHMAVLVDSGFRRGADIVKALALGAKAVLVARATLYGLAAGGEAGVARALDILRDEVDRTVALMGRTRVTDLSRDDLLQVNSPRDRR
ncbi:MAG: alpha-hydroxy acid oxidase [Variovorax sp.]